MDSAKTNRVAHCGDAVSEDAMLEILHVITGIRFSIYRPELALVGSKFVLLPESDVEGSDDKRLWVVE